MRASVVVLAMCMLLTGTINTIATKYQVRCTGEQAKVNCDGDTPSTCIDQPVCKQLAMHTTDNLSSCACILHLQDIIVIGYGPDGTPITFRYGKYMTSKREGLLLHLASRACRLQGSVQALEQLHSVVAAHCLGTFTAAWQTIVKPSGCAMYDPLPTQQCYTLLIHVVGTLLFRVPACSWVRACV